MTNVKIKIVLRFISKPETHGKMKYLLVINMNLFIYLTKL